MTAAEAATLCVAAATLLSALASVILALRGIQLQSRTHDLVNGQSQGIQELREAKGHAEGRTEGVIEGLATRPAIQQHIHTGRGDAAPQPHEPVIDKQ